MNIKKSLCIIVIVCLVWNMSLTAEGISVKLRGKIGLFGILSGIAYLTHTLVKRDTQAAMTLQSKLGTPERTLQIEDGFNRWTVNYYHGEPYFFLNNRFIRKKTTKVLFLNQLSLNFTGQSLLHYSNSRWNVSYPLHSVIYRSSSVNPKWLSLFSWHQPLTPPLGFLGLPQLEDGRLHFPDHWHSHLK